MAQSLSKKFSTLSLSKPQQPIAGMDSKNFDNGTEWPAVVKAYFQPSTDASPTTKANWLKKMWSILANADDATLARLVEEISTVNHIKMLVKSLDSKDKDEHEHALNLIGNMTYIKNDTLLLVRLFESGVLSRVCTHLLLGVEHFRHASCLIVTNFAHTPNAKYLDTLLPVIPILKSLLWHHNATTRIYVAYAFYGCVCLLPDSEMADMLSHLLDKMPIALPKDEYELLKADIVKFGKTNPSYKKCWTSGPRKHHYGPS